MSTYADETSSDDDIPLSSLGQKRAGAVLGDDDESEEAEFISGESEKEECLMEEDLKDAENDEYTDEDAPLAKLGNKRKVSPKKRSVATKKIKTSKKRTEQNKATTKKKSDLSTVSFATISAAIYSKSTKGKLIQALLCRWWYAMSWPDTKTIPSDTPQHYDTLDGFPGVYICTSGEDVGKLLDSRDKSACPNFTNMMKKSSEELKDLLLGAIEGQRTALHRSENGFRNGNSSGRVTGVEKTLKELERWVKKVNVTKADKEAEKVLKSIGITNSTV